jgi:hypothetical protein
VGLKRLLVIAVLGLAGSVLLVPGASAGNFDEQRMGCTGEDPGICPTGTTGQAYTLPIELLGDEDEGCAVYTVSGGSLPPGLSVNSDGARISGTPTQAGTFDFYLTVTYNRQTTCPFKNPSDDRFRISINPGLAKLTIGPESTTPGTVGASYSLQMTATVADPKTWSISSGALPPGLAIDAATGLIAGTPTAAGQFDFQVLAKMNADTRSDTKALGIVVRDQLGVLGAEPFTAARRAAGEVSAPFDATLTATGGDGTYTWSLTSGVLPPGLDIADGAISGTPTTAGVYPFTATVTDAEGRVANYPARILIAEKLAISTTLLRPARQGIYYQAKLNTAGGVLPRTWRIVRGPLPRGIRFDRSAGLLFGIPTRPGRFRVTFEATDALDVTAKKTLAILVVAAPKPKPKKPTTG